MKHIRRIFESTREDQFEDIESVFTEYLDQKYTADDGNEYSDCYIGKDEQFVYITISSCLESPAITDIKDFDKIFKERSEYLSLLKRIRVSLLRLEGMGYDWTLDFNEEGFNIKAFYKDTIVTLADCFGGYSDMQRVDEPILKKYMLDKYNINYNSCRYRPETKGYYGKRSEIIIYFREIIPAELLEELKKITKTYKVWSTLDGDTNRTERAFYKVEASGNTLKIQL